MEPRSRPDPASDDFDPESHIWDGRDWWTSDGVHWWDGSKWLPRGARLGPAPKVVRKRRPVARVISGVMHSSVLGLLVLPLVSFEAGCGGILDAQVNGYQALVGFNLPQIQIPPFSVDYQLVSLPPYGPNPWVLLVIVAALAGVVAARIGGLRAAEARLATAATAATASWVAVSLAYRSFDYQNITVNVDVGGGPLLITVVMVVAFLADALSVLLVAPRSRSSAPAPGAPEPVAAHEPVEPPGGQVPPAAPTT